MLSIKDQLQWIEIDGNRVHKTAVVYWDYVSIGKGNIIGEFAVIGSPGEILGKSDFKGMISIGDDNIINSHVTIDRPHQAGMLTQILNNCFIMRHSHIGHDAVIGSNCILRTGTMIGGHVTLADDCNTGLNASVRPRLKMGFGSFLGMGGVLVKDQPPFTIYAGNPAKPLKDNEVKIKELGINAADVVRERLKWKLEL